MSTPPPPPPGDATPPPAGDIPPADPAPAAPAAPAMAPHAQFAAPVAKKAGSKKIIFILIGVIALGGIGFAGYKFGPDLWAKYFGGGDINTPDGAIKRVFNGLADNKPEVLWEALPAKHQKLINDEIKKSSANVDPEVQTKIVEVLKKTVGILKSKKALLLETAKTMAGQGESIPTEVTENWDGIVGLLEIVVNSKALTPEWGKNPDVGAVLKEDGGKLMSSAAFEKFANLAMAEADDADAPKNMAQLRTWLKGIQVTVISSTETTAKLKLSSADFKISEEAAELDMVKIEGRWLPTEIAEGLDQLVEIIKQTVPMGQQLGGDTQMTDQQKTMLLNFLSTLDRALDTINAAATSDELLAAVGQMMGGALGQQFAGLGEAFGGGIPGIGPGPGIRPGTNPSTIIPGLGPTGPPKSPGYKTNWSIGGGSYKIDEIYPGKTEAIITQVFGDPAQKQGDYWTYRGLKVRNMKLGGTYTTVIFQMQNGKVARVIVQP